MRNRPYIIRKERERAGKIFKLFFKKGLTKGIFSAILHINNTDDTADTVKTKTFQRGSW